MSRNAAWMSSLPVLHERCLGPRPLTWLLARLFAGCRQKARRRTRKLLSCGVIYDICVSSGFTQCGSHQLGIVPGPNNCEAHVNMQFGCIYRDGIGKPLKLARGPRHGGVIGEGFATLDLWYRWSRNRARALPDIQRERQREREREREREIAYALNSPPTCECKFGVM